MPDLPILITLLQLVLKDRTQLALENIALRQQLAVYKRTVKRPKIEDRDRIFWLSVMRMLKEWKAALVSVRVVTACDVISTPALGGLHHRYSRSAA